MNELTLFSTESSFELAQRQAKALSSSTIIPKDFQGNISNCLIALELSHRLELSPFIVLQSLYVVHGKPGFSASFIIAQINSSGRYAEPLQFRIEGTGDNKYCVAFTKDKKGTIQEGPAVSIGIAKAEGWYSRTGSKWKTMPDLMLRYRAATLFGRLYVPELLLGMQSYEELQDAQQPPKVINAEPKEPLREKIKKKKAAPKKPDALDLTNKIAAAKGFKELQQIDEGIINEHKWEDRELNLINNAVANKIKELNKQQDVEQGTKDFVNMMDAEAAREPHGTNNEVSDGPRDKGGQG